MNLMGYDAMALGPKELSLGLDVLRQRMAASDFPMLSANVVLSGSQELLAEPYTILEVGGQRLGVIGLTRQPPAPIPGVQVLDPQRAAARYVAEVAAQAGTVIVLTNLSETSAQALALALPDIDLVIAALPEQQPVQAVAAPGTNTLVLVADLATSGHSGRRVGMLAAAIQPDGSLVAQTWQSRWIDKRLADDPAMVALLAKYQ